MRVRVQVSFAFVLHQTQVQRLNWIRLTAAFRHALRGDDRLAVALQMMVPFLPAQLSVPALARVVVVVVELADSVETRCHPLCAVRITTRAQRRICRLSASQERI